MTHISEDDLVLHYYGEPEGRDDGEVAAHLAACGECRQAFTRLQRVLGAVDESAVAPALPPGFERTVWARLQPNLSRGRRWWWSWSALTPAHAALTVLVLILVASAFFAGRVSSPAADPAAASAAQVRERVLLVDLGDHLDQSQMVLIELVSGAADGPVDFSGERAHAEQLLAANRLYRQTAASTGDRAVSDLLEELERMLTEVAAAPEQWSGEELDGMRRQIDARGLLFRVRVVSSEVRERQRLAIQRRTSQRL
jgi:hypothetical protein